MIPDLKSDDEEGRVQALNRLGVLDTEEEAPFDKIVALIQQVVQVPMCAVSLVDRHRQWFKARRGLDVRQTPRDISFCTHAIRQSKPFVIRDALDDPRFAENPLVTAAPFIRSYAGIPLKTPDGYNVGTLCAIDTKARPFPDAEITILESFAKVVVDQLELRQIASSDYLTGAMSRRAWMEKARTEIERASRHGRPLSLAVFDIDRFKSINDTYGHAAGDRVIQDIARLCMATKRQSDLFGRLGGEEFVLLFPETTVANATFVVDRVRTLFARMPLSFAPQVHVTVSAGIAGLRPAETDLEPLLQRADGALYQAKTNGRNRTVVAPEDQTVRAVGRVKMRCRVDAERNA